MYIASNGIKTAVILNDSARKIKSIRLELLDPAEKEV